MSFGAPRYYVSPVYHRLIKINLWYKYVNKDPPYDIVQGLIAIGSVFKNQRSNPNIFICGIFPHDESFSVNRLIINEVNNLPKSKCLVKSFYFINQSNGWTLNNGALDFLLFYSKLKSEIFNGKK